MPLYVGDYLGDTQRLTTEQHGAYLLLILDYWRNGPAPDDDAVLQQITKLDRSAWKKHRPALARLFQVDDGEWKHKRIDQELAAAQTHSERRSSKAKAAAQARWANATSNAPSMPQAMLEECPPQSQSPKRAIGKPIASAAKRGSRLSADFEMPDDWLQWAMSERHWSAADARDEGAGFIDYWHAKAGKDAVKLDWAGTWRNWVRNSRRAVIVGHQPRVPL
jgi:uncharacterized protein YdaU (DUF1376 family)